MAGNDTEDTSTEQAVDATQNCQTPDEDDSNHTIIVDYNCSTEANQQSEPMAATVMQHAAESDNSLAPTASSLLNQEALLVKRGRGRPRKNPVLNDRSLHKASMQGRRRTAVTADSFNDNCRVVDYVEEGGQIWYKVEGEGGTRTLTSKVLCEKCPLNVIYFLESRLHLKNSLPFKSIVAYVEHLKKYY